MKKLISLITVILVFVICLFFNSMRVDDNDDSHQNIIDTNQNTTNNEHVLNNDENTQNTQENSDNKITVKVEPLDSTFVRVSDYITNLEVDLLYATKENFTNEIIYDFEDVYLRYGTVKKLMKVSDELNKLNLGIKIWDGYRPMVAQKKLWSICPDPKYVSNPEKGNRTHIRGIAIDLTLYDLSSKEELMMPSGFDDFSLRADRDYSDCSDEAKKNSQLLEDIMVKYGFEPYLGEWWHYSDSQQYEIEESFNPSATVNYYADCNEYISLRKSPSTSSDVITKISKDETVTFLGYDSGFAYIEYDGHIGYVLNEYLEEL